MRYSACGGRAPWWRASRRRMIEASRPGRSALRLPDWATASTTRARRISRSWTASSIAVELGTQRGEIAGGRGAPAFEWRRFLGVRGRGRDSFDRGGARHRSGRRGAREIASCVPRCNLWPGWSGDRSKARGFAPGRHQRALPGSAKGGALCPLREGLDGRGDGAPRRVAARPTLLGRAAPIAAPVPPPVQPLQPLDCKGAAFAGAWAAKRTKGAKPP